MRDLATPGSVQLRQTLALWTLASRLPGERPLLEMNGDILRTQQCSSGVRYERKRRKRMKADVVGDPWSNSTLQFLILVIYQSGKRTIRLCCRLPNVMLAALNAEAMVTNTAWHFEAKWTAKSQQCQYLADAPQIHPQHYPTKQLLTLLHVTLVPPIIPQRGTFKIARVEFLVQTPFTPPHTTKC